MFGEVFKCSKCDFEFTTGWSHHECGQLLLCIGCGTHFKASNPETMWGPDSSKPLNLLRERYVKKTKSWEWADTGVTLRSSETARSGSKDGLFYFLHEACAELQCPSCKQHRIVETIDGEPKCPKCHDGAVQAEGTCIY